MTDENADMHRFDIVAALHKKGLTVKQLSLDAGLGSSTLSNALSRPYPKAEKIIAQALGMEPEQIWPSRYSS